MRTTFFNIEQYDSQKLFVVKPDSHGVLSTSLLKIVWLERWEYLARYYV